MGIKEQGICMIQVTSIGLGLHPNYRSGFQQEILTNGFWHHPLSRSTYVVNKQVVLPSYRCWDCVILRNPRRINVYKAPCSNVLGNHKIVYLHQYIGTHWNYPQNFTGFKFLVQGIYQQYDTQVVIHEVQVGYLSLIQSQQTSDWNYQDLHVWNSGN